MTRFLPLSRPVLRGNEWKYLKECLDTGWVSSSGPFVERFEQEVAGYVGAPHAVAVVNGTAALHTALHAVDVKPDDEVVVSDLTFIAPVNAIRYCGAHPVFMDADQATWQMDVAKLARFLERRCEMRDGACRNRRTGRRVSAVLPVHVLGLACDIESVVALARRWGLRVVEDACEAMGVRYRGRHVGTFGDAGAFSFNGNKIVTAGGGGIVVTADRSVEQRARYFSTQAKDDEVEYIHNGIGQNYRLTNIAAALGVAQLEQIEPFLERKRALARDYACRMRRLPDVVAMPEPADAEATWWLYTVLLPEGTTRERRAGVVERLRAEGIGARPLWHTIHDLPPYRACEAFEIIHAVRLYERGVSLPSSVDVGPEDVERVVDALARSLA